MEEEKNKDEFITVNKEAQFISQNHETEERFELTSMDIVSNSEQNFEKLNESHKITNHQINSLVEDVTTSEKIPCKFDNLCESIDSDGTHLNSTCDELKVDIKKSPRSDPSELECKSADKQMNKCIVSEISQEILNSGHCTNVITEVANGNKEIPDFIQRIIEFLDSSRFNKSTGDVNCTENRMACSPSEIKTKSDTMNIKDTSTLNHESIIDTEGAGPVSSFELDNHCNNETTSNENSIKVVSENRQVENENLNIKNMTPLADFRSSNIEKSDLPVSELTSLETMNDLFDDESDINYKRNVNTSEGLDHLRRATYIDNPTGMNDDPSTNFVHLKNANRSENEKLNIENGGIQKSSDGEFNISDVDSNIHVTFKSSLKRTNDQEAEKEFFSSKKSKKGITFDSVSVYYFPRTQGFTCIPSQGGSTLGMSWNHSHIRKFSLGEHAAEQRRVHRLYSSQQFSSSRNWNEISNVSSEDSDSDEILSDSEMDYENYNFLQPIPTRERRAMLRASGIHKIDSGEKDECRSIRLSREFCGCTCQMYCDPERCVCAQAGIKCQVDRMNFPCSCSREGCANENGRIEFNPVRVRTHYIHTLMRLEMEKKKEEEERRNRMILSNLENSSQLSYSTDSSSPSVSGNNFMNFSYHNNLLSYYSQASTYGVSAASTLDNACFNMNYVTANDQFVLPPVNESASYYQSNSTDLRLSIDNSSSSDAEYRSSLSPSSEKCLRMSEYGSMLKEQINHDYIIHDLTNGSEDRDKNVPYNDTFVQLGSEKFEENIENTSQGGNLDTSTEVSEETEKEESDSENFGDIIKKTMVESVIA